MLLTVAVALLGGLGSGLAVLLIAAALMWLTWAALVGMGVLTARAALGLSRWRKARLPKIIGFQEMIYGFGFVLLVVLGH